MQLSSRSDLDEQITHKPSKTATHEEQSEAWNYAGHEVGRTRGTAEGVKAKSPDEVDKSCTKDAREKRLKA